jgi:hypothetical protein
MSTARPSVQHHFVGKPPEVRAAYDRLGKAVSKFGEWAEDPKKTSIHFNRTTAFAGIATRKEAILLTVKACRKITSPRIVKSERTSANRWHHVIRLTKPSDVDSELISWLREAYELSA